MLNVDRVNLSVIFCVNFSIFMATFKVRERIRIVNDGFNVCVTIRFNFYRIMVWENRGLVL